MTNKVKRSGVVAADPLQWCEASQRSVSFGWTKEYRDIKYSCWCCSKVAIFSAEDQRYTFEVKKAPIDQRRILCADCWSKSESIARELEMCEESWIASKTTLRKDKVFLSHWLQLLVSMEGYVPYRPNVAAKNMLQKLLTELA